MALQPFLKIVVDKKEEAKFRRRALAHYPYEHIEALWGEVRGDTLYICAFVQVEIEQATVNTIHYDDQELDFHEEDAREHGFHFLGTIHTHPNCSDARFGDTDLAESQESQEVVMGICAIDFVGEGKNKRRHCIIEYWPTIRPLQVVRKDWNGKSTSQKAGKKSRKDGKSKRG